MNKEGKRVQREARKGQEREEEGMRGDVLQ